MAVSYLPSVTSYTNMLAGIVALLTNPVVGFLSVGGITAEGIAFSVFRRKSFYNTSGTSEQEYFYVLVGNDSNKLILGTCVSSDGAAFTNKPPNSSLPTLQSVSFPCRVMAVANSNRVAIGVLDNAGVNQCVYVTCVNFSSLNQVNINSSPTHAANMANNLQVYGKLGSSQRLLYAGNLTDGTEYDRGCTLSNLADSFTDALNGQIAGAVVSTVGVSSDSDEYFGILDNVYLSKSTVFHTFDKPVDSAGNFYRVLKDSASAQSLIVKESP